MSRDLLPCPFCGGSVNLEQPAPTWSESHGQRNWWGVKCRNTENLGGTCCIEQVPSASKEAAITRWNRRAQPVQPASDLERYLTKNYPDARGDDLTARVIDALETMDVALGMSEVAQLVQPAECVWHEDDGIYVTGCDRAWSFTAGGLEDNHVRYCHFCGGKICAPPAIKETP